MPNTGNIGWVGYIVIAGTVFCLIIAIALQYATLHQTQKPNEQEVGGEPQASATAKLSISDKLRLKFPGMFYSPSEFAENVRLFKNFTQTTGDPSRQSSFTPLCEGTYCTIVAEEYHTCCCRVKSGFQTPKTAIDVHGINRTLAQFDGMNQYFYTESCQQTSSVCSDCSCTPVRLFATGVYNIDVTAEEYGVAFFEIGNTCKDLRLGHTGLTDE